MTKEEIAALKSRVEAFCPKPASADQIHLHVLKALDALEAAHREIERLAKIVSKIESELCGPRVDPSCFCCDETRRILGLPIWESTT